MPQKSIYVTLHCCFPYLIALLRCRRREQGRALLRPRCQELLLLLKAETRGVSALEEHVIVSDLVNV